MEAGSENGKERPKAQTTLTAVQLNIPIVSGLLVEDLIELLDLRGAS